MNRGVAIVAAGLAVLVAAPIPGSVLAATDDARLCGIETARQEQRDAIPDHLLHAISLVESGRWDAAHRQRFAWPWTVMSEGEGHFLASKQAAIDLVRRLQARGVRNIDVGCMQVNLQAHPAAFATLEQAFDPVDNVAYAAAFLRHLHEGTGNWPTAAAYYHSQTPPLAMAYETRVVAEWNAALRHGEDRVLVADVTAGGPAATPANAQEWFAQGSAALLAHDYAAAEPALLHAVALDRGNVLYLDALGATAFARGNAPRALAAYQMAIALDRDDGFAWYNTAVIHYNAGRMDSAIDAFRRAGIAYANKGDMANAARVLSDLKSLSEGAKS